MAADWDAVLREGSMSEAKLMAFLGRSEEGFAPAQCPSGEPHEVVSAVRQKQWDEEFQKVYYVWRVELRQASGALGYWSFHEGGSHPLGQALENGEDVIGRTFYLTQKDAFLHQLMTVRGRVRVTDGGTERAYVRKQE